MVVRPLASTAASIRFSVAPTDGVGNRMSAPCKPSGAVASIIPPSSATVAPIARSPARWKSMPRRPIASPPGNGSRASPQRPSSRTEARIRETNSRSMSAGRSRSAEIVTARPSARDDQFISHPNRCSSAASTATSRLPGTLRRVTRCGVSKADTISGRTAVLGTADRIGADERPAAAYCENASGVGPPRRRGAEKRGGDHRGTIGACR
jgi:hypothetical protein